MLICCPVNEHVLYSIRIMNGSVLYSEFSFIQKNLYSQSNFHLVQLTVPMQMQNYQVRKKKLLFNSNFRLIYDPCLISKNIRLSYFHHLGLFWHFTELYETAHKILLVSSGQFQCKILFAKQTKKQKNIFNFSVSFKEIRNNAFC